MDHFNLYDKWIGNEIPKHPSEIKPNSLNSLQTVVLKTIQGKT